MRLSRRAERDLEDIEEYLAREAGINVAIRVVSDILERLAKLDGFLASAGTPRPELGTDIRSWPLGSYTAYYREKNREAEIARIWHGSRDPDTLTME